MTLRPSAAHESPALVPREPRFTLADLVGMPRMVARLREAVIDRVPSAEAVAALGTGPRIGLVLFGPPGCGWERIAEAVAGDLGAGLMVGRLGADHPGAGAIVQAARAAADVGPTILLLRDLADLAREAGSSQPRGLADVVGLLDRRHGDGGRVLVIGATSRPWDLDPVLLRAGHLDQLVFVPPPDAVVRRALMLEHLAGRRVDEGVDVDVVVSATHEFSCVELARVVEQAAELALADHLEHRSDVQITQRHLVAATTSVAATPPAWLRRARTYAAYANPRGILDGVLDSWPSSGGSGS